MHIGTYNFGDTFSAQQVFGVAVRDLCVLLILIPSSHSLLWIFLLLFCFVLVCIYMFTLFVYFNFDF